MNILITGATGNVGGTLLRKLESCEHHMRIIAAFKTALGINLSTQLYDEARYLDFTNTLSFESALKDVDVLFLVRPPQLSSVNKYFKPLINQAVATGVSHIIFLSVQGAETNSWIPHHKIEKLIKRSKIPYTFLRPGYFMQNFSGNLHHDLISTNEIFLPAGDAKFTLVDVDDLANVTTSILLNLEEHRNMAYALTNNEQLTFGEMAETLSSVLQRKIKFISPSLLKFYCRKKKEGMATMLILVMIMLHYLPRFSKPSPITNTVEKISGSKPNTFRQYVENHKSEFDFPRLG